MNDAITTAEKGHKTRKTAPLQEHEGVVQEDGGERVPLRDLLAGSQLGLHRKFPLCLPQDA